MLQRNEPLKVAVKDDKIFFQGINDFLKAASARAHRGTKSQADRGEDEFIVKEADLELRDADIANHIRKQFIGKVSGPATRPDAAQQ